MTAETGPRALAVRGESTNGRVASAGGPDARRGGAGDVSVHRRADATQQTAPRPGRGRARGAVPRSRFRRNPKGTEPSNHCRPEMPVWNVRFHSARSAAWVLLGSAIVRLAKIARPRMRAIAALLLLDDPHRDRLRRRALRSPHNTHARDPLYFHHGLLAALPAARA